MVRHRVRITRIIAAILTLAFSAQIAGAQLASCSRMTGMHATHGSMMQHDHRGDAEGAAVTRSEGSDNRDPGAMACAPTMLCANPAAVPAAAMRTFQLSDNASQISFGPSVPKAHTIPPELPPPRS